MGCGACVEACVGGGLCLGPQGVPQLDRGVCSGCLSSDRQTPGSACPSVEACPTEALELLGRRMGVEALKRELLKDAAYFRRSERGGVTLSGGEASSQPSFARETLRALSEAGIHTALDTCGFVPWASLEALYPFVDLVLWDLKDVDPGRHESCTGQGNELVIENFRRTVAAMESGGRPGALWVRTPIIPGATDREDNLFGLGRLIGALAPQRLERWELCAFNNLCADKYAALGRAWAFAGTPLCAPETMARLVEAARSGLAAGAAERAPGRRAVDLGVVSYTGATRMGKERME